MKYHKNFYIIISLFICFTAYLSFMKIVDAEASQFESNLSLGSEIDAGHGMVKIMKVSEAMKSPIYENSTKEDGNKFIIIETVVSSIDTDSKLESIAFCLVTSKGVRFDVPSSYGKVEVLGNLSNFEATDGAVVYAYNKGDALNIFFEVPQSIDLKTIRLTYSLSQQ